MACTQKTVAVSATQQTSMIDVSVCTFNHLVYVIKQSATSRTSASNCIIVNMHCVRCANIPWDTPAPLWPFCGRGKPHQFHYQPPTKSQAYSSKRQRSFTKCLEAKQMQNSRQVINRRACRPISLK